MKYVLTFIMFSLFSLSIWAGTDLCRVNPLGQDICVGNTALYINEGDIYSISLNELDYSDMDKIEIATVKKVIHSQPIVKIKTKSQGIINTQADKVIAPIDCKYCNTIKLDLIPKCHSQADAKSVYVLSRFTNGLIAVSKRKNARLRNSVLIEEDCLDI